jgi:hypothetical protein
MTTPHPPSLADAAVELQACLAFSKDMRSLVHLSPETEARVNAIFDLIENADLHDPAMGNMADGLSMLCVRASSTTVNRFVDLMPPFKKHQLFPVLNAAGTMVPLDNLRALLPNLRDCLLDVVREEPAYQILNVTFFDNLASFGVLDDSREDMVENHQSIFDFLVKEGFFTPELMLEALPDMADVSPGRRGMGYLKIALERHAMACEVGMPLEPTPAGGASRSPRL